MEKIQGNQLKGQNHLKEVGKPMLYTHVEINGVSTTLKMGNNKMVLTKTTPYVMPTQRETIAHLPRT